MNTDINLTNVLITVLTVSWAIWKYFDIKKQKAKAKERAEQKKLDDEEKAKRIERENDLNKAINTLSDNIITVFDKNDALYDAVVGASTGIDVEKFKQIYSEKIERARAKNKIAEHPLNEP